MSKQKILVTGGAGYIGSHVVRQLGEAGEDVITLDNLSTGFKEAVLYGELVIGDTGDMDCVSQIFSEHDISTVMHFAAHTIVPESVSDPLKYYGNNTCNTRNLLECCQEFNVNQFVFSSTAAVYGIPDSKEPVTEQTPTSPINPYGTSKLLSEWMMRDLANATDFKYVALRYFNVAGCDLEGKIGQSTPNATLLTKVACEVAVGKRDEMYIFGTDYPTKDGTGVRDYIHVEDLAAAHLDALKYLRKDSSQSQILNCGYGHGFSVQEMIDMVNQVNDSPIKAIEKPRRAGDPPELIANPSKAQSILGWKPKYDDLKIIVETALNWEKHLKESKI